MRKRIWQPLLILIGFVLLLVPPAMGQDGQPTPEQLKLRNEIAPALPGTIRQSLEKKTVRQPSPMPEITIRTDEGKALDGAADATFELEGVVFDGNEVISSKQLETLVRPYYDTDISVSTLQQITERITTYYIDQGYILSRAFLPPQEIKDGRVLIRVREGALGRIIVKGNQRYKTEIFDRVMDIVKERGAVRRADLERALLLLMDNPAMKVRADLMAGERPGTTDIIVHAEETKWWALGIDYNNFGSEYVGSDRIGLNAAFYSPFGWGDELKLNFTAGDIDEMLYERVQYTLPINYSGTRLGLSFSHLDTDPDGVIADTVKSGSGDYASIWLSHPIVRSRTFNWWVDGGVDYDHTKNEFFDNTVYDDELYNARAGSQFQWVDGFAGNNSAYFDVVKGLKDETLESTTFGAESNFIKYELGFTRYQLIPLETILTPYQLYAIFTANGQMSGDRLPSSQRIHIGGAGTVRGYEQSEYSGDRGVYATLEFRVPVWRPRVEWNWLRSFGSSAELQLATFIDTGYYEVEKIAVNEPEADGSITGAGLGVRFQLDPTMLLRIDWAKSVAGEDPDVGHYDDDGVWYIQFSALY